jgi:hypothetical protein
MRRETSGRFQLHCATLELGSTFGPGELKAAYRKQIFAWHPDRHHGDPGMRDTVVQKAQAINAAYEYLSELLEAGALPPPSPNGSAAGTASSWRDRCDTYQTQHTYRGKTYSTGLPDPTVLEIFLKSSHIVSTGYDPELQVLFIKFDDFSVYKYFDVAESVFQDFVAAESHGKYAHRQIYRSHKYVRC